MMRHDEALMWEYAARELPSEDAKLVQHHLTECPDCQEKLTDVHTARGALQAARGQSMTFTYGRADAAIAKTIEKRMARAVFGRPWIMALSGGLVAAGLALTAYGVWSKLPHSPAPAPTLAEVAAPIAKPTPAVEQATGLTLVGAQSTVVEGGSKLASGDVLRTDWKGEATLRLPEGTRVRLGQSSQLSLTRAETDDITLALDRGRVAIAASHARRKGFVLHTNGLMVTVVGTRFSVTSSRDGVEVAVAEGKVSVEPPSGLPMFVNAGQRVRFDARWRSTRAPITVAQKKELAALADAPAPAPEPVKPAMPNPAREAAVPAGGGVPPPAPAASADEMKSLVASTVDELSPLPPPVPARASAPPPAPAPAAVEASKPDMSGLEVPLLVSPVESVKPTPAGEWGAFPKPAEVPVAPTRAAKLSGEDEIPIDAEAIFIQRAERSFGNGTCERFLLGLDEVASDPKRGPRAEKARIMRARCFDALMRTKETEQEYRRYVREYPTGTFMDEARAVMGDR